MYACQLAHYDLPISPVVSATVGYISACETEEEESDGGDKDMSLVRE